MTRKPVTDPQFDLFVPYTVVKHSNLINFLLMDNRDLDAAKRFFRKVLSAEPLLASDRIGLDGLTYSPESTTHPMQTRSCPRLRSLLWEQRRPLGTPRLTTRVTPFRGVVQVGFTALTAPRTVTLPDVDLYPSGQVVFVANESGQCSIDWLITIEVGVGTGDSIAGQSAIQLTDAYQGLGFRRGAANVWIIAR